MARSNGGERERVEWLKCSKSFTYFVHNYCQIYDATFGDWIRFELWPSQKQVCEALQNHRLNVILKARQLGMTWLVLCFILWQMLFHPVFTALVFSRREPEALYLLSKSRLRGIYNRLPDWMRARQVVTDSTHIFQLSNESVCYAFPTTAGDSYTAGLAFVDEADLVPDLEDLMTAVKPTIDGGGRMVLLSRVDKETPNSTFKRTFQAARSGKSPWNWVFLPWTARPGRDMAWYLEQKSDIKTRTGALDDLYEQYPATPEEALQPLTLDKRLPYSWLLRSYKPIEPFDHVDHGVPGLRVYKEPKWSEDFVVSADPAEGNPESDDSSLHVLDANTGEECAVLNDKIEPSTFAEYLFRLSEIYNDAPILVERNNHGHAVILALNESHQANVMMGWDDKDGWMTSRRGKALMYTNTADMLRDGPCTIHDQETFTQLASIGGKDLAAPEGSPDDVATSFGLGCSAIALSGGVAEYGRDPTAGHRG